MTHRTIPVIRDRIVELADELATSPRARIVDIAKELKELAQETRRRPATRRAPARRADPDAARQAAIRAYVAAHPTMDYQDIGQRFGVNSGRVSEAVAGKRE